MVGTVVAFSDGTNFADPATVSVDVGSSADRCAYVLLGRSTSASFPSGVTVGTDTLVAQGGADLVDPGGAHWRMYAGMLTVTGVQTVSGDYTSSSAAARMLGIVLDGVDPGGFASNVAYSNSATSTSPPSFVVASAVSSLVMAILVDSAFGARTLAPSAPATQVSATGVGGTTGFYIMQEAGAASVTIDGTFSGSASWRGVSFSVAGTVPTATLSGGALLSGITASGGMAPLPDSSMSGAAVLAGMTADGGMGLAPGVLTTPVLKNNAGTILASVTGIVANIYHPTTGALIVRKTGLSSSGAGIVTISDVLIAGGTTYAYELDLSATAQGRRLPTGVAA